MTKGIPLAAIALLAVLLSWISFVWEPTPEGSAGHEQLLLDERPSGGDFELASVDGPVSLSDLRGRVVLLYFGYTACPDVCPTNLAIIALALRELTPDELAQVQVVFVSVDPERDGLDRLADYVGYFHPSIVGVTGTEQEVAAVAAQYGAAYQRSDQSGSAMGYTVDHSAYTYLIDASGALVDVLDHATPAEELVAMLRRQFPPKAP